MSNADFVWVPYERCFIGRMVSSENLLMIRTLTNAGEEFLHLLREQHRITPCFASHTQQSRYISHFLSRKRGAKILLHLYVKCKKRLHLRSWARQPRIQPVCGRQVRRKKWPIMILLEISQHAVVEVRFLWCLSAFYGRNRRQSGLTAQQMPWCLFFLSLRHFGSGE